jgi:hypothetical protein
MNISTERLTGDHATITKLNDLISCFNCQKHSLSNTYYDQPCHKGVYCQECISFCSKCCQVKGQPIQGMDLLLKSVSIKCINSPNGCNQLLAIGDIPNHEKLCTFCQNTRPITSEFGNSNSLNEIFKFGKSSPQANMALPSNYECTLESSKIINQKFPFLKKDSKQSRENQVLIINLYASGKNSSKDSKTIRKSQKALSSNS